MHTKYSNSGGRRYQYDPAKELQRKKPVDQTDLALVVNVPTSSRSNKLLLAVAATFGLMGLMLASQGVFTEGNWWAVYYSDTDDQTEYTDLGRHDSLEQCRAAVTDHIRISGAVLGTYDYECGLNCTRLTDGLDRFVCEDNQR